MRPQQYQWYITFKGMYLQAWQIATGKKFNITNKSHFVDLLEAFTQTTDNG